MDELRSLIRETTRRVITEVRKKWMRYFIQTLDHLGADDIRAPREDELRVDGQPLDLQFNRDGVEVTIPRQGVVSGGLRAPVETAEKVWKELQRS